MLEGLTSQETTRTVILHDVPIPHRSSLPLPLLPRLLPPLQRRPHDSPAHDAQPRAQQPPFRHAHIAQFLPVGPGGEEDVPAGDGRVVEEGDDGGGGEEDVRKGRRREEGVWRL